MSLDAARVRTLASVGALRVVKVVAVAGLTALLFGALVVGGMAIAPAIGAPPVEAERFTRRPPIVPPMVPQGAREDWAVWTYVDKINQAWGKDWPLVIQCLEELYARYPGNWMVFDKLYVSFI